MENRELTVDDLSSPVDESMQSEIQPAMSYFAEGGEVEQGLFSQQIPQRPTVQVPQQRLKRTAAEMLQRMPQVPLGTMRFSPLSMPGILGRQIPRFAQGGEVDAEQRALMARQMDLGAPTENLFGANLSMPSLPPAVSFETNIPSFTPTYTPPTGPVTTPGTAGALGQYPGIGNGAELQYQQTLYEQLSPTTLAAPATTFTTATGYTPTAQTTATPTLLSREEAMLKQPTLVRYEPDVKFGGLTTYTGPLQQSPYTGGSDTTEPGTGTVKQPPLNIDRFALLGFRPPTEGGVTGEGKYWFNPSMGYVFVPGGYTPEDGSGWTEVGSEDFLNPPKPEVPINWMDTDFFVTDTYKTPLDQPRVSNLTDVFTLIAGSDVSEAAQSLFKNPSYGWVPDPTNPEGGSFNMTPEAVNNVRSSEPFKSAVSDTVKKLYNELGYTVGGDKTTATNVSDADVANWVNAISAGQTDIFRAANTITSPMRMSGQLQLTPNRPTLTSIYVNSGLTIPGHLNKAQIDAAYQKVLGRPADNAGLLFYAADPSVKGKFGTAVALEEMLSKTREAQVQAAYRQSLGRAADPAGLAYYTSGAGRNVDIGAYLPTSREAQVRQAYSDVLKRAADTPGLQYYTSGAGSNVPISELRTMFSGGERPPAARFRGSPPEGEYADPVAALRERMRMRREAGTMDQGTARDRLKKFLGGEDLTPVRMAEGGDVSRESQVRKVYQDVLGRAADEAGLQYYTTGEGKRYAAAQLADMFGASREGQIQKLYQNVLGRSTDPGGMDYYLRGEGRALTPDQIAEGFRGSEEYKSKQRTTAPAAVTTTKGPRPLTREGLLQEAMLFGGNSYNALGAYGPNSLNRRGYLTEKGRQQMINEIQPKAVADLIMRGQSVGLSPDEIQQAVQSGWQRGAESNRDFVVAEREAQANFVPEWFKIASALAGAHMMGTQILNQGASSLAPAASGASVSSASVPIFGTPYTGMELGKIGAAAVQGYQNPNRASAANIVNTVFPSPFGALPRIEDIELFNQGGLVKRKDDGDISGLYQAPLEPTFGQRMGAKASDLLTKGLINLVDVADVPGAFDKSRMSAAHKIYLDTFGLKENRAPITKDYFNQEELQALVDLIEKKGGPKGSITYEDYKRIDKLAPERKVKKSEILAGLLPPRMSVSKALGQFNYELDPNTNQYRILDEYDFNPKELERIKAFSNSDFIGDYVADNPFDVYTIARMYGGRKMPPGMGRKVDISVPATKPVKRKDGSPVYGEIAIGEGGFTKDTLRGLRSGRGGDTFLSDSAKMLRNVFGEGVSNLESVVRGSVAAIPGSAGDIESIFRDDKNRKLATTEEILRDRMPKRMTKPTKEAGGFEEVGTYLPLPIPAGAVSKAATTTGKGVEKGAAKMLERLGPRTGRRWESLLAQAGAAPMYAVKPKGGTFYPEGMGSGVDNYLDRVVQGLTGAANLAGRDAKAVADFIRTKGRKYLTSVYGTEDDPLRLAVSEGRMPLYGSDQERFRDYLLDAARAGNPNAIKDLERFYDDATQLGVQGYIPASSADPSYVVGNRMQTAQRERLLAEGVPEDLINPIYPSTSSAEQMASASYSSEARQKLGQLLQEMEGLPPDIRESYVRGVGETDKGIQSLLYSATKEQPIYDMSTTPSMDFLRPGNVAEGIASIPLSELERMTFPEAVVKGAQNMRLKRDRGLMLEKARDGKTVPKEIYFEGTQPVYEIDKNQKWVRIMSPDAVELEGAAMRHSIGGYKTSDNYNLGGRPAFESGLARIFSLRNEKGVPQVTVETKFTDEDGLIIKEVRSKFNSEPTAEEKRAVLQLFETLGPKEIKSTSYRNSRTGETLKEEDRVTVNWGDEFKNYLQYKNKGEE